MPRHTMSKYDEQWSSIATVLVHGSGSRHIHGAQREDSCAPTASLNIRCFAIDRSVAAAGAFLSSQGRCFVDLLFLLRLLISAPRSLPKAWSGSVPMRLRLAPPELLWGFHTSWRNKFSRNSKEGSLRGFWSVDRLDGKKARLQFMDKKISRMICTNESI